MRVILDVRNGDENNESTELCSRRVDGHVSFEDGVALRKGRFAYRAGGDLGDVLFIASGDGSIGVDLRAVEFVKLFSRGDLHYYSTGLRDGLVTGVRDDVGDSLRVLYGGSVVESAREDLDVGEADVGLGFWWTRNDVERVRFSGDALLGGGAGEYLGVVGGELESVSSLVGEILVGGESYEVGGVEFPLVDEAVDGEVVGYVMRDSGEVVFVGGDVGEGVYFIRGELGGSGLLLSGDYLSPCPSANEHPLLRDGARGYMEARRVVDFSEEVEFGVVEYNVRGEVRVGELLSGGLIYDGLVLSSSPVGLRGSYDEVPVEMIPDGTGLEPIAGASGFRSDGSGLVLSYYGGRHWVESGGELLELLFVEELPSRLDSRYGYVVRGSREVFGVSGGRIFVGEVEAMYSRQVSQLSVSNWGMSSGSFFLTSGEEVFFDGSSVSGSDGVVMEGGHLVVLDGYEVAYRELPVLSALGLVPGGLSTGLILELGGSSVSGFYSYDDESVGDISGVTDYQFLSFEARRDFVGYDVGTYFRVSEKLLREFEDIEPVSVGFRWVESSVSSGEVREETSRLFLGHGVIAGSTSLSLSKEVVGGGQVDVIYEEGIGYDLEGSQITLKKAIGEEVSRGAGVSDGLVGKVLTGGNLEALREGDWILYGGDYLKVVSILGGELILSGDVLSGGGVWVAYRGYREGVVGEETPDLSRLSGEVFEVIGAGGDVVVYKVYSDLRLEAAELGSTSLVRKGDAEYVLTILRDERVESPRYEYPEGDVHVASGSYVLRVGGVSYEEGVDVGGKRFTVSGSRFVFESFDGSAWVEDVSWLSTEVILSRLPREGLSDVAEASLETGELSAPFDGAADYFLTSLSGVRHNNTSGAISFDEPLESGVGIEVSYVTSEGVRVYETLIFYVSSEEMVRSTSRKYSYNTLGREVELEISPSVYVDSELQPSSKYTYTGDSVLFKFDIGESSLVKISYGVLNAVGGEQSVRLSGSILGSSFKVSKGSTLLSSPVALEVESGDIVKLGSHLFVMGEGLQLSPPARFEIESSSIEVLRIPSLTYSSGSYQNAFFSLVGCTVESSPKSPNLFIHGDFRSHFISGVVFLVGGIPYLVKQSDLTAEGMTKVTVEGFVSGHKISSSGEGELIVSYRPVYFGGESELVLSTGLVAGSPRSLIRYNHVSGRGVGLVEGLDYKIDSESGRISLTSSGVEQGVSYYLLHTALSSLKPESLFGGRVSYPKYTASYRKALVPTRYDGLKLMSKSVVYSPDTFKIRIVEEEVYAAEVASDLIDRQQPATRGGKRSFEVVGSEGVSLGYFDLVAEDVVARSRVRKYEGYIKPIEDLVSTSTGHVVGDLDGRFRFDLEYSGEWGGSGLEDPITREIHPRYVFQEILDPLNPLDLYPLPSDPIKIGGVTPELDQVRELMALQPDMVSNEIDDYVLVGWEGRVLGFFDYAFYPVYRQGWERSPFSRLFPSVTEIQTLRVPGDLYSNRDGRSTNGATIAQVENGALGSIGNVSSLTLKKRPARFRVVSFSSTGYFNINPLSGGKPTFLVSAVPLDEFPILNGLPDTSRFLSQGGDLPDASSGSPERMFRGLAVGAHVELDFEGDFYPIFNITEESTLSEDLDYEAEPQLRYAKVEAVLDGCLVVLDGLAFAMIVNGVVLGELNVKKGSTLVESLLKDLDDESASTTYRVGSDVGLRSSTGEILDISLPSISDPSFPFKELAQQNVPPSLMALEGEAGFYYDSTSPFIYPALNGLALNDSGDEGIPYLKTLSERVLLADSPKVLARLLLATESTSSLVEESVYPDEVRDDSTQVVDSALVTTVDLSSLNGDAEQTPRQGDLILLAPDETSAATGVMELALIDGGSLYPPHFQAPTQGNSFSLTNMAVDLSGNPTQGVTVKESLIYNNATNEWDSSVSIFTFVGYGKIDSVLDKLSLEGGVLTLKLYDYNDPTDVFKVVFAYSNGWVIKTINKDGVELSATNTLITSYGADWIEVTQDPIPNPLTIAEEVFWPNQSHETWLYDFVASSHFWGAMLGYRFFTSQGSDRVTELSLTGTYPVLFLDYSLDVSYDLNASNYIEDNRLDFTSSLRFDTWLYSESDEAILLVAGGGVTPLDITPYLDITSSQMTFHEESGVGSHLVVSDINTNQLLGHDAYAIDGVVSEALPNGSLRIKSLYDVSRSGDPMSIFVGSEVDEDGNIFEGVGRLGEYDSTLSTDDGVGYLRYESTSHGDLGNVAIGDLLYIYGGHSAGTHRVKSVIPEDIDEVLTLTLEAGSALKVSFPQVVSASLDGSLTLQTDVDDLSLYFHATGDAVVLLNTNYLTAPSSNQVGVYDQDFSTSLLRFEYDSISGNSFTISNPLEYADGSQVTLANAVGLLVEGLTVAGVHKIPFDPMLTGLFNSAHPVEVSAQYSYSLKVAGGISGNTSGLSNYEDEDDLTTALILDETQLPNIEDTTAGNSYGRVFFLPSDTLTLQITASKGLFLDESFPRLLRDYRGADPVVFGDGSSQVRSATEYSLSNPPAWDSYEEVSFVVRRLRRFTDLFSEMVYNLEGYRYLYEHRSGQVGLVTREGDLIKLVPQKVDYLDTNVGDFQDVISLGDVVTCRDSSQAETLKLRVSEVAEGYLKGKVLGGDVSALHESFHIEVRVGLVPEMQSFDSFISHAFEEVYSTGAVASISVGEENVLTDTAVDFSTLLEEGEVYYLVIDPQGLLDGTISEYGQPPLGDLSDGTLGDPSALDDNRGAYKVVSFEGDSLTVEFVGESSFLPTVGGVVSNPLRVTSGIENGTYTGSSDSIHPFSYRVLKKSYHLSEDLASRVLFFRERTLSWIEKIEIFNNLPTSALTWSEYESGSYIEQVGVRDRTHPSNDLLISTLLGDGAYPFSDDLLSFNDRRLLVEDPQLVMEGHELLTGMPSLLEGALGSMGSREKRNLWIGVRTDEVEGTLPRLRRVDRSIFNMKPLEDVNE